MARDPELFDFHRRMHQLSEKNDPLERLNVVEWEIFRKLLKKVTKKLPGGVGRPPFDEVMMFKILILQRLYDLSDEQTEYQIKDRLSFMRFLGFDFHSDVPDENTIRNFREKLNEHKLMRKLFDRFNRMLDEKGLISKKGSIIDATIIDVPRQRNTREENEQIKNGETPADWEQNQNKMAQKDTDARWLKQNGRTYYGYKNHARVDRKSKLVEDYTVTPASTHDSEAAAQIIKSAPNDTPLYADSAYHSKVINALIKSKKLEDKVIAKAYRNKPLRKSQIRRNRGISRIRARIEHVFGDMEKIGGDFIRTIGKSRAEFQVGLINLVYNMRRFTFLYA